MICSEVRKIQSYWFISGYYKETNDEDLLLAIRDVDGVDIPASVMRRKEKLSESLKGKENIVLAVYRQRDGKLDQMSI